MVPVLKPLQRPAAVSFAESLSFEDVRHAYGAVETLRGLTLTANAGEILCLLGPSGSGKTTSLRIAAGLEGGHGGRVLLSDREIGGPTAFLPPEKRGIAYMFQDFALFPHMTVVGNTMFGLTSMNRREARKLAMTSLERVGLAEMADRHPHMLSGGQQQRVALARALVMRPGVILMDEPFSGLDTRLKDAVRADTLRILRETRATAVIVTHDAEEAMRLGDRIALLRDGRLVQAGTSYDLYHHPVDLFTAQFFSDLNILPGHVSGGTADCAVGRFDARNMQDGPVEVGIRPTSFDYDPDGPLQAKVVARRFLGEGDAFTLALEDRSEPLRVRLRDGTVPPGATRVGLSIRQSDVLVFESGKQSA